MIFAIVFLPLFAALSAACFSRFLGREGVCFLTTSSVGMSALLSCLITQDMIYHHHVYYFDLFNWIRIGTMDINFGFLVDSVTCFMLIIITFISTLVHLYSIGYMSHDPHLPRFMSYLSFFTFCMLILVTSNNFIQLFFGWEGVGLASYLLINFWHTRMQANKSAIKAMIVNRLGDFGLGLGIFCIFYVFKSLDFGVVFSLAESASHTYLSILGSDYHAITVISLLLFVGSVGKSAQLGLHTWLPDAMEGPTPVSALIHAATMVTAGVFLLIRCSPLIEFSPNALTVISIVGAFTAFFAASVALVQNDLKRIIAYSTCSQLGYMVFACGMSSYHVAMFHLVNHAFFKALLFLGAGSVIHAIQDEQDIRKMGGLAKLLPLTYTCMFIASLSLMGFPFLTGFYSKDLILEVACYHYTFQGQFLYYIGTTTALITAFYSIRLLYLTFITKSNSYRPYINGIHEPNLFMIIPLILLTFGSVFFGFLFKDLFVGLGTDFWGSSIFIRYEEAYRLIESEFLPFYVKLAPVVLSCFSALCSFYLYNSCTLWLVRVKWFFIEVYKFLNKKWYFDAIYNSFIVNKLLQFGYKVTFMNIDKGYLELLGPKGIAQWLKQISINISYIQTGYIYHYLFLMVIGLVFFILISIYVIPVQITVMLLVIMALVIKK